MAAKKKATTAAASPITQGVVTAATPTESEEKKCVWQIGTPCSEKVVAKVEFFNHQIAIPCCEKHIQEHKEIMVLHKNGYDVEEILNQTPEWRKQEVLTLQLSGLDSGEVEL